MEETDKYYEEEEDSVGNDPDDGNTRHVQIDMSGFKPDTLLEMDHVPSFCFKQYKIGIIASSFSPNTKMGHQEWYDHCEEIYTNWLWSKKDYLTNYIGFTDRGRDGSKRHDEESHERAKARFQRMEDGDKIQVIEMRLAQQWVRRLEKSDEMHY
tara:strand:- start:904 stop:1365 length:462 start_codon:yes stop_codon:yes gene_type:complete